MVQCSISAVHSSLSFRFGTTYFSLISGIWCLTLTRLARTWQSMDYSQLVVIYLAVISHVSSLRLMLSYVTNLFPLLFRSRISACQLSYATKLFSFIVQIPGQGLSAQLCNQSVSLIVQIPGQGWSKLTMIFSKTITSIHLLLNHRIIIIAWGGNRDNAH